MNNYIQIELGGKLRGLKFNNLALQVFWQSVDLTMTETAAYAMVWGGLVGNAYVKKEELDCTFEDVCDWVDCLDKETIAKVDELLNNLELYKKKLAEITEKIRLLTETPEAEKKNLA